MRMDVTHRFGFARMQMPSKCPDCGQRMSEIKYDSNHWDHLWGSARSVRHYRDCGCGCILMWGYAPEHLPRLVAAFVRTHVLPLFAERETVQIVDKF